MNVLVQPSDSRGDMQVGADVSEDSQRVAKV